MTFHALGLRFARQWSTELGLRIGPLRGLQRGRGPALLLEAPRSARGPLTADRSLNGLPTSRSYGSRWTEPPVTDARRLVVREYEDLLRRRSAIDYPAMLGLPLRLFGERPVRFASVPGRLPIRPGGRVSGRVRRPVRTASTGRRSGTATWSRSATHDRLCMAGVGRTSTSWTDCGRIFPETRCFHSTRTSARPDGSSHWRMRWPSHSAVSLRSGPTIHRASVPSCSPPPTSNLRRPMSRLRSLSGIRAADREARRDRRSLSDQSSGQRTDRRSSRTSPAISGSRRRRSPRPAGG